MDFQVEPILRVRHELTELLQSHMEELCIFDNCILKPCYETYNMFELNKMFFIVTARDKGKLIGYSAYIIAPSMHYGGVTTATNDVLYLSPQYRKGLTGIKLIKYSEVYIRDNFPNTTHITHKYKEYFDLGTLFKRMGYQEMERTVIKEL